MTWDTNVVNDNVVDIQVNGNTLSPGASVLLSGVHNVVITFSGGNFIRLTDPNPDEDFHKFGIGTTWAVKVVAGHFLRYWGYEGQPTVVITVHDDGTFSLPDQGNTSFDLIPIAGPAIAQYAGVYTTNTNFWGAFFSPFTINVNGTVSVGSGSSVVNLQPTYDSRTGSVSLAWTAFQTTTFQAAFGIAGTGTNIKLSGGLNPRPQDGQVHFSGDMQTRSPFSTQASRLHQLALTSEFPLFFDAFNTTPLTFAGAAAMIRGNASSPDYFRLIPLDNTDSTKGYYLRCHHLYASKEYATYNGVACVPGTRLITSAIVFQPVFLSKTTFKLSAPSYVNPAPGGSQMINPMLSCSSGTTPAMSADNTTGFQFAFKIPFSGSSVAARVALNQQWHYFLSLSFAFPLVLKDSMSLELSGNRPEPLLLPLNGSAPFTFVQVAPDDYTQGYRISSGGFFIESAMGRSGNVDCIKLSSTATNAAVFELKLLSTLSFQVRNISSWQVLTQPGDLLANGTLRARPTVVYDTAGDSVGFAGINQLFQLPAWAARIMQMAYLPSSLEFSLQYQDGKIVYADANGVLQIDTTVPDSGSAVISVATREPGKTHSGYIMTVGSSKYVKFTANDASIVLVTDISQASPLCLVGHNDGTMSFWNCMSNHVLAPNTGSGVVFTGLTDASALEPRWKIIAAASHSSFHTLSVADTATTSLGDTVNLKPIVNMLTADFTRMRKSTWDVSFNNVFLEDWLLATPKGAFGNYADLEMGIRDPNATNDFKLKAYVAGEPVDPIHPAVSLASSVTQPGGTPLTLHAGHSRALFEQMYGVMISANKIVDIISMCRKDGTPSGQFLAAIRNAITYLSNKPSAQDIAIRVLLGMPGGLFGQAGSGPYWTAERVLNELVRDVQSPSTRMQVYVAYYTEPFVWNHAKIVAADGLAAVSGGHNMWDGAYLWENPVLDVSMQLSGLAATDGHHFADTMWRNVRPSYEHAVADPGIPPHFIYLASFTMPGRSFNTSQTGYTALPPELLFDTLLPEAAHDPARQSGDGIPVLSVARLGSDWAGWAASDRAIVTLLDSATTSIHISAQSIKSYTPFLGDWPFEYIYAIGRALTRSVRVKIFLSSVGGSYGGDLPLDVITEIRNGIQNKTDPEITTLMQLLTVQSFPLPSKWSLPPTSPTSRGISNHAKVMVVDSRAVYIGSQNFYPTRPAWLSEFTYIFEDTTRAQQFVNSYFVPMETWCQPPPPLPAGARPVITQYQVTIVDLRLPWQAPDFFGGSPKYEVYLKHNDSRVWPTDNKYLAMSWLKLESVGITLPSFTSISNEQVMDIMDYNYIMSDDKLATFKFKPADLQKLVAGRNYEKRDSGYEMTYSFMSVVLP